MDSDVKQTNLEYIPPEGGWGYMICVALTIINIACYSHTDSFGMLFDDFLSAHGSATSGLTSVFVVSSIVYSFSGLAVNVGVKWLSNRQVGIIGAVLYTGGWFLNVFVTDVSHLLITYGGIQCLGIGILTTISYTSFNTYFVVKSSMMMSMCQMVVSIATIGCPLLLEYTLRVYGFRGTILIIAALVSHVIFAVICMHPVSWYGKKVTDYSKVTQGESKLVEVKDQNFALDPEEKNPELKKLKSETDINVTDSHFDIEVETNEPNSVGIKNFIITQWYKLVDVMDLTLLQDIKFLNIGLGVTIGVFNDSSFFVLLPLYLYSIGTETAGVATCLSLLAAADLVSRAFMAIVCKFVHITNRNIFLFGTCSIFVSRIFFLQCKTYNSILVMTSVLGFLRGLIDMPSTLVFADYLGDRFTAGMGLYMMFMGVFCAGVYPILGMIQESTNSFISMFYTLNVLDLVIITTWVIEIIYMKKKSNRTFNSA